MDLDKCYNYTLDYFAIPLAAGATFIILNTEIVSQFMTEHIPNPLFRLFVLALIIFTIVYIVTRLVLIYRHNCCSQKSDNPCMRSLTAE